MNCFRLWIYCVVFYKQTRYRLYRLGLNRLPTKVRDILREGAKAEEVSKHIKQRILA